MTSTMIDQESGSFVTGFTIGLFAGAAGYFLFATDKGQTVRAELVKEWQAAKKKLADEGFEFPAEAEDATEDLLKNQVKPKVLKIKQALQQAVENWLELDEENGGKKQSPASRKKKSRKKTNRSEKKSTKANKSKKFKNL